MTTPKPGLVDQNDTGAHCDMDIQTFIISIGAIAGYLIEMADTGLGWEEPAGLLFPELRKIGVQAEQAMLQATRGVNTHKGAIFSMGLAAAAAGLYFRRFGFVDAGEMLLLCREICGSWLQQDFARIKRCAPRTHGEFLYVRYGERGIRGEAQEGFPVIREVTLPKMKEWTALGYARNEINIQVLLHLLSAVNDTNILARSDYETLAWVKRQAVAALSKGGAFTEEGVESVRRMNAAFIKRNISPGGCADLLALTMFADRMEQALCRSAF